MILLFSPAATGCNPKFFDIVFFSADYLSLGLYKDIQGGVDPSPLSNLKYWTQKCTENALVKLDSPL